MGDMKELMREHYIAYASYVILDRAIPDISDGLKPVQRRILYTLFRMHDGKFHKVANITGQTMALHPHGDAPIYEALVAIANKNYLIDCQGNFGNTLTGDPAAASRYIEARLSSLALETCFNSRLTEMAPSYDGRNSEPILLPMKIPLLLLQGAEGIAVGMSTKILPHNFNELLQAEIAYLQGESFELLPDFLSGGICDASGYMSGKGKVRVRAKLEFRDQKTIIIRELPYGITTESLINSIEEASKRGKVKIESIHDYTSDQVEIEIHLPRGSHIKDVEEQLYAFTDCEISLSPIMVVIKDGSPTEISVTEAIEFYAEKLKGYLKRELEIELQEIQHSIFIKTLEQIFIDEKLYKEIEEVKEYKAVFPVLENSLHPFLHLLEKQPVHDEYERLLSIPIRRIAQFDRIKNMKEIDELQKKRNRAQKSLRNLTEYTIAFLKGLLEKYGKEHIRRTIISQLGEIDKKEIERKEIEVNYDLQSGYIGLKVSSSTKINCTNFDKLLIFYDDGVYKVISIEEKEYIGRVESAIIGIYVADKSTIYSSLYLDTDSGLSYCKRFVIKQFILNKEYSYLEKGQKLILFTHKKEERYLITLVPKLKQKMNAFHFSLGSVLVKNVAAKGVRLSSRPTLSITAG
ncbi:MAG: DNA topoisomerase IV subunit A [Chlamydia sp.]